MKNFTLLLSGLLLTSFFACAQADKSKRPSPPATATAVLANGAKLSIDYSQPALKGRTMGKDVEPMNGKVWRAGANEATVFETSQALSFGGQSLPAGKYGLFLLVENGEAMFIFNKVWNQWGSGAYKASEDQLRVKAQTAAVSSAMDRLTYLLDAQKGSISLVWGNSSWTITAQ